MPKYRITLSDGRVVTLEAAQPPTEAQVLSALGAGQSRPQAPAAVAPSPARTWTDTAVDAIPTVAGAAGGLIGGIGGTVAGVGVGGVPGALGGAAVGGAGGEALRQLINRARGAPAPGTPLGAAQGIGTQGAIQGASELAGHGVMAGARMAGRGLMDFAIRPAPTVAEEFGDIALTAIKERLPVGRILPGARTGSQRAKAALRESGTTTRGLLSEADRAGASFAPAAIATGPVTKLVGDIAKQPLSTDELRHVSRLFSEYLDTQPGRMTSMSVKDMKQAAQRIAKPIFKALNRGEAVPAGESIKAQFNKAIADGAKEALETIPGVGASEARTKGLIGATHAIRRAESRRLPLVVELAAPIAGAAVGGRTSGSEGAVQGVGVALLTRALLSPRTTSRAALGLTAPAIQETIRQMPRGAVYALLEEVTGTTP